MGLETLAVLGITALATGAAAQQSHAQAVHAGQDKRDAITQQNQFQAQAKQQAQDSQLQLADQAARARQRAVAASYAATNQPGVTTNNSGNLGQANTASKTLLGL